MRKFFNDGQELIFGDLNEMSAAIEKSFYDRVIFELLQKTEDAFFGDGFKVSYSGPTGVNVSAGLGFQTDSSAVDPEPAKKLLRLASTASLSLQAPDASHDRIDIVVAKYALGDDSTATRKYKDPTTSVISDEDFVVRKDESATVEIVTGTPAASPTVPTTPDGYIKLAELAVTAVSGMSGSGDVTDKRNLMPVGGNLSIDSSAFLRTTAGAATPVSTILSQLDTLAKFGYFNYWDVDELGAIPATPGAGKRRLYVKDGTLFMKDSSGVSLPIGSGGGGGAGANWVEPSGSAPVSDEEYSQKIFKFEPGNGDEKLVLWVPVPDSYIAGRPVAMKINAYSPSSSGTILLKAVTTLIQKDVDGVDDTTDQYTSTNTALTNTVANQDRELSIDLSNATGQINGVGISAGDMLKVELSRYTDTDTDDVRFMPNSTRLSFT